MTNPLENPSRNPLKKIYEEFWVPVFGRLVNRFVVLIEGERSQVKPTYNLRTKDEN